MAVTGLPLLQVPPNISRPATASPELRPPKSMASPRALSSRPEALRAPMPHATLAPTMDSNEMVAAAPSQAVGLRARLSNLLSELEALPCSRLEAREDASGTLVVRGRLSRAEDRGLLEQLVAEAGAPATRIQVDLVAAPFCSVLDAIEPHAGDGLAPTLTMNHADGVFQAGDFVVLTVRMPDDIPTSYLHVIYVDNAGKVVHMLPNRFRRDQTVRPNQIVQLGVEEKDRRSDVRDFRVVAPFGAGLVLAVLSPAPLPGVGELEVESVNAFIHKVKAALSSGAAPVRIAGAWLLTRPAP
jgi:hypothetical protein